MRKQMSDSAWIPAKERAYLLAAVGGGAKLLDHTYTADSVIRELVEALRNRYTDKHQHGNGSIAAFPDRCSCAHCRGWFVLKRVDALMGEDDARS
jgi:hypothetical protein